MLSYSDTQRYRAGRSACLKELVVFERRRPSFSHRTKALIVGDRVALACREDRLSLIWNPQCFGPAVLAIADAETTKSSGQRQ